MIFDDIESLIFDLRLGVRGCPAILRIFDGQPTLKVFQYFPYVKVPSSNGPNSIYLHEAFLLEIG